MRLSKRFKKVSSAQRRRLVLDRGADTVLASTSGAGSLVFVNAEGLAELKRLLHSEQRKFL